MNGGDFLVIYKNSKKRFRTMYHAITWLQNAGMAAVSQNPVDFELVLRRHGLEPLEYFQDQDGGIAAVCVERD